MGDCADDIVKTLSINEATASFDVVKTALNGYFEARRNVIVERARFNRRRQNPGESVAPLFKTYTASPKIVSTEL